MPRTARCLLTLFAFLVLSAAASPSARAQGPPPRKDIEDLPTDELNRYKDAVKKLKESGRYAEFAKLHNGPGFPSLPYCQHRNELFFPWHRSLLYSFEKALQAIDPGVTIPYWRWTVAPKGGGRYPAAFEGGASNPLWFNRSATAPAPPMFNEDQLRQAIKDTSQWNAFAGSKKGQPSAYGRIEQPFHNDLHGFCGEPMATPQTAAQDPIFWSFHAYIDYIWHRWQKQWPNEPVGCQDCELRRLTDKTLVKDVIDIEAQLNYTYAPSAAPPPGPGPEPSGVVGVAPAGAQEAVRNDVLSMKAVRPARQSGPFVFNITIPEPGFSTAHIHIADIELPRTISYSGAIYLYPARVPLNAGSPAFRRRYFVERISIWVDPPGEGGDPAEHAEHGGRTVSLYADATTEFRYLAKTQPGSAWNVAIVLDAPAPPNALERLVPRNQRRLSLGEEVKFGGVTVVLDHFLKR